RVKIFTAEHTIYSDHICLHSSSCALLDPPPSLSLSPSPSPSKHCLLLFSFCVPHLVQSVLPIPSQAWASHWGKANLPEISPLKKSPSP
ncbi:mCG145326, partial [Mus musculus]